MKLSAFNKLNELMMYFIIGGIATAIDWTTFWVMNTQAHIYYQVCLMSGYITAGTFHFIANKFITFGCQSKKIGSQFSLYLVVTLTSLLFSMGVMAFIVNLVAIDKLHARILTTIIMFFPNYLLHKHISFSKKIFLQPEVN